MPLDKAGVEWDTTSCIEWPHARTQRGYGRVGTRKYGTRRAHVVAWIKVNGPIPPETPCVLHRCDNPPCVNVAHLFLGTVAENNADRAAKGRSAKTKPSQVRDLCSRCGGEYTQGSRQKRCRTCENAARRKAA